MATERNLLACYQDYIDSHHMNYDEAQVRALQQLTIVQQALEQRQKSTWLTNFWRRPEPIKGLYLWGGVGRGKTFLMDLFYEHLTSDRKRRMHFHRFMHWVHDELKSRQGSRNPLQKIASEFAKDVDLVCFDEFFVSDITDAMLLSGIFQSLFAAGVVLVATSNVEPVNLYRNGLQRERFLPAIDFIMTHCKVYELVSDTDHRLRQLEQANLYYSPCDERNMAAFRRSFDDLAPEEGEIETTMDIEGRPIAVHRLASDVAWFSFGALCAGPRSQVDYIELSRLLHTVFISEVPQLKPDAEDQARRFISLIDEFYERNVKLIIAADVPLEAIYRGDKLEFEFERTISRLIEMQSKSYLAKAHLP